MRSSTDIFFLSVLRSAFLNEIFSLESQSSETNSTLKILLKPSHRILYLKPQVANHLIHGN